MKGGGRLALFGLLILLAGCATPPPDDDPDVQAAWREADDPIEPFNRAVFYFNGAIDTVVLKPAAKGYRAATPRFLRDRVSDFLGNLHTPMRMVNDLLQGNLGRARVTFERFVLNSSFGVLGFMDVAAPLGLPRHEADFGQTLGVWGVPPGPYLMLPFLGQADLRDGIGLVTELGANSAAIYYALPKDRWLAVGWFASEAVSRREYYLDYYDEVRRNSLDPYATLRSIYQQRRAALVLEGGRGGDHPPP